MNENGGNIVDSWFETVLDALHGWLIDHGWRVILIIVISSLIRRFGMVFVGRLIERSINKSERFENDRDRKLRADTVVSMVGSVLKALTWIVVVLLVLSELNILKLLLPLMAGAGILSLLLGFGIQTFIKDFISGIFVVLENQYRVGDIVSVTASVGGAVEGRVIRITLRTTVLRDEEGSIHFIPNGNVTRAANLTLDYAKVNIELSLPINADFEKAEAEINGLGMVMQKEDRWQPILLVAPYYHGVQTLSEEAVTVEVRAKTVPAEQWEVSSELQKRLAQLLSANKFFETKSAKHLKN